MIESLALIIIVGLSLSYIAKVVKLPSLIGFLIAGIVLGPAVLNLIDESILEISMDLRKIALIIILFRAGLTLNLESLKQIGKVSILLSFIPAMLEIVVITIIANLFLGFSIQTALLLGTVIAAASPAVIVPKMIELINEKKGRGGLLPKMIMTSAAVEDVIVIILFATVLEINISGSADIIMLLLLPLQIILGGLIGYAMGYFISLLINFFNIKLGNVVLVILAFSFLMVRVEELNNFILNFSGLIAVMSLGLSISKHQKDNSKAIESSFSNLWLFAQIILFVLVGASIEIRGTIKDIDIALIIIALGLLARFIGIVISFIGSKYTSKERKFTMISFIPKATVQAAIGGIALEYGISNGETILSVAVISILFTAPLGAILIDKYSKKI